jgi:hypothetical protein
MTSGAKHPALPFLRSPEKGKVVSAAEAVRLVRGDGRLRRHRLCRGDRHRDRSTLENSATTGWRSYS